MNAGTFGRYELEIAAKEHCGCWRLCSIEEGLKRSGLFGVDYPSSTVTTKNMKIWRSFIVYSVS